MTWGEVCRLPLPQPQGVVVTLWPPFLSRRLVSAPGLSRERTQAPHSCGAVFLLFPPREELLATTEASRPSGAATSCITLGFHFWPVERNDYFVLWWDYAVPFRYLSWMGWQRRSKHGPATADLTAALLLDLEFLEGKNCFFGSYAPIRSTVPALRRSIETCDGSEIS